MNFSTWGDYDKSRIIDKLDGIVTEIRDGGMPLPVYLPLHPEAKLSDNDKKVLVDWAQTTKDQLVNNK